MNPTSHEITSVVANHRSVTAHYQGGHVNAVLDMAHLRRVSVLLHANNSLIWQLDGLDHAVMLIPFGVPGEAVLRRELQDLPSFNTHLLFSYLDDRADQVPPLVLWQA